MKGLICLGALIVAQGTAWAQERAPAFGERGHFAVSTERLFGYSHVSQTTAANDNMPFESTMTTNNISLLNSPFSSAVSFLNFPRLAFDVFAAPGLSLGASLGYFHTSQSASANPAPL